MRFRAKQIKALLVLVFVLCMIYVWRMSPLPLPLRLITTASGALIVITAFLAARD
jgi:hypothetical protein